MAVAGAPLPGALLFAAAARLRSGAAMTFQSQLDEFEAGHQGQSSPRKAKDQPQKQQWGAGFQPAAGLQPALLPQWMIRSAVLSMGLSEPKAPIGKPPSPDQTASPAESIDLVQETEPVGQAVPPATLPGDAIAPRPAPLPASTQLSATDHADAPKKPAFVDPDIIPELSNQAGETACPTRPTPQHAGHSSLAEETTPEHADIISAPGSLRPETTPQHADLISSCSALKGETAPQHAIPPISTADTAPRQPEITPVLQNAPGETASGAFSRPFSGEVAFEGRIADKNSSADSRTPFAAFVPQPSAAAHEAAPPVSAPAHTHLDTEPPQPEPVVRDVRVRLESATGERAEVRVVEAGGEVRLSVRADAPLSQALRDSLPDLKTQLERSDVAAQVWRSSGGNGSESGSQQQYQPEWVEHLAQQAARQKQTRRRP